MDTSEHSFEESTSLRLVDRLRRRAQDNAETPKCQTKQLVVALISSKTAQVVDDDGVNFLTPLTTSLQKTVELGSVPGLRTLTLLAKDTDDLHAVLLAVRPTNVFLVGEAQVVALPGV